MNNVKKLSGLVLIAAAFAVLPMHPAAFADDSDIFGANYQPGFCTGVDCNGEAKIDIAKRVLKNLIDNVTGVRFGFMKFWNNDVSGASCNLSGHCGASMVAQMGTTPSVMKAAVDAISPFGYTPLGEMMHDAGLYYE